MANGCEALDQIENRGRDMGFNEGVEMVWKFVSLLLEEGREADLAVASHDERRCAEMIDAFRLYPLEKQPREKPPESLSEVFDRIEYNGRIFGVCEGMKQMRRMLGKLFDTNRVDDVKRASQDTDFRKELMEEFGVQPCLVRR